MDKKAKEGAPQIEIREFSDLRDVRPFVSDKRYDGLPLRAILGIVRQKGLQKVGVDIADCDGAPAGCVAFQWDYRGDSRSCYLFALFVKPEFRRNGVAERLVKSFCDNYRKVVLGVEGGNEPAVRLYKKLGFEFTGENEPVEDKDIKVMERTKKFSIRFDEHVRRFSSDGEPKKKRNPKYEDYGDYDWRDEDEEPYFTDDRPLTKGDFRRWQRMRNRAALLGIGLGTALGVGTACLRHH